MEQYSYIGDVKKLIPLGWTFQKLYASNYKSYHKHMVFMFVVSGMILEISNVKQCDQPVIIKFILDNKDKPESFWYSDMTESLSDNWVLQNGLICSRREAVLNKHKWYNEYRENENIPYLDDGVIIEYEMVCDILSINEIGGVKIVNAAMEDNE